MAHFAGYREDIYGGPVRSGNRGGLGLFKWDAVKDNHKEKDHYLGSTVKAAQGRWQKNKKLDWYHTDKAELDKKVDVDEIARIKLMEQEAMGLALQGQVTKEIVVDDKIKEKLKKKIKKKDEHISFTFR
ncbi:kinase phosphorylation protein-domain-containing protein [Gorgonomyces haynaldii]|nr:kinase phosphorylation protein-domain-containing protein [Gorgonomyces haynaldii]